MLGKYYTTELHLKSLYYYRGFCYIAKACLGLVIILLKLPEGENDYVSTYM